MRARTTGLLASLALVVGLMAGAGPASGRSCPAEPTYDDSIPTPESSIPGFPDRRATTLEIVDYFKNLGDASARVDTGVYGKSYGGTEMVYSLVAKGSRLDELDRIAAKQQALRDPRTTNSTEAARIARRNPAIVWYTANVHGNETSGADAAITIAYDLAARRDCAVQKMLDELVVGIIPTQNPDGRDAFSRTNNYGFDMNRDWFARTQRETDTKLDLLERYPPVLFIDAHEMGSSDYFFPPNADPIYHEISPQSLHWINIYSKAIKRAFEEKQGSDPANWDYFNYNVYDLFYMGYGDTVPTTAFTSAGMTFEKGIADPDRQRWEEQLVAGWESLRAAARKKDDILSQYYKAHVTAMSEGRRGKLEPNIIIEPDNELQNRVPDLRVRHYFLHPRRAEANVLRLIERLLKMDVEVHRLTRPLRVPDLRPYGGPKRAATLPRGTYWIPLEQPQKRWIQALFGEDTYVPFPYFYDVTAWNNPMLMNLRAWFSGARLSPRAKKVARVPRSGFRGNLASARSFWWRGDSEMAVAGALALARKDVAVVRLERARRLEGRRVPAGSFMASAPGISRRIVRRHALTLHATRAAPRGQRFTQPKVALLDALGGGESLGHMRWLFERRWKIPYTPLTALQVAAGQLESGDYDVFVVPGVTTGDLDPAAPQIGSWIEGGGIYVGTARPGNSGGTPYAVRHGFTTAQIESGSAQIPGTLFGMDLRGPSPVALGAPGDGFAYHLGEELLLPSETGQNVGIYPRDGLFFSGYAEGQKELRGTAAVVDEALGDGRVVLFSGEPNYRAYTEGTSFLLANALVYPLGRAPESQDVASERVAALVRRAVRSVPPAIGPGRPIQIQVALRDAAAARRVLEGFTDEIISRPGTHGLVFEIPNPEGLERHSHPYSWRLIPALRAAGVEVLSAIL